MKKLLSFLMAAALTLSLAACGGGDSSTPAASTPAAGGNAGASTPAADSSKPRIAYIVGNLGDKSFSDSGERGMDVLRGEGYEVKTIETMNQADKYTDYFLDAIDQGYDYILASSTYYDTMRPLAKEYPDVKFVLFDDNKSADELEPNMSCIFYAQYEGSYLVGMMAAAMSKTGTVACDLGIMNPVLGDFVTGYVNGVLDWNKDHGTDVKVVVAEVGSWTDAAKMKSLCLDQARNNNADVFYQVAGGAGDGVFEACIESETWAIGVDSDQYLQYKEGENPEKADVILTSMLKEVGNSLVAIIHQIDAGEDVWQKTITLGLKDDSVGYVDNEFFQENVPQEVRDAMAEAKDKIKAGELKVKSYFDFADEAEYNAYIESAR